MSYTKDDYEKMVGEQAFLDKALVELGAAAVARAVLGNSSLQYQLGHAAGEIAVQLLQERRQHQKTGVTASYEQLRDAHSLIGGERLDELRVTGQAAYEAWRELPSTKRDYQKTMSWSELSAAEQDEWATIERAVIASLTGPKKPTKPLSELAAELLHEYGRSIASEEDNYRKSPWAAMEQWYREKCVQEAEDGIKNGFTIWRLVVDLLRAKGMA